MATKAAPAVSNFAFVAEVPLAGRVARGTACGAPVQSIQEPCPGHYKNLHRKQPAGAMKANGLASIAAPTTAFVEDILLQRMLVLSQASKSL